MAMSDNEWHRVVNEWYSKRQRMTTSGTARDNEWQQVTKNGNEWQRMIVSDKTNE